MTTIHLTQTVQPRMKRITTMGKTILCAVLLMLGSALSASAFENWILAYSEKAREVSADEFAAAEGRFLAESDSLWTAIKAHLEPWDDAFFTSQPNPLVLHEGTYLVDAEYSGVGVTYGMIKVSGISFATHAGELLMQDSEMMDIAGKHVIWLGSPDMEPYCYRASAADLLAELESYQEMVNRVLPENEASHQAQEALDRIRSVYESILRRNGNLQGFTIAAAVKLADLDEATLRAWQFSVMTQVGTNIPIRYVATCVHTEAPYNGQRVWYDVREAKYHGMAVDGVAWTF